MTVRETQVCSGRWQLEPHPQPVGWSVNRHALLLRNKADEWVNQVAFSAWCFDPHGGLGGRASFDEDICPRLPEAVGLNRAMMPIVRTARKAPECHEQVVVVSTDFKHAFPLVPYERLWVALREKLGARLVLTVFRNLLGAEVFLSWHGCVDPRLLTYAGGGGKTPPRLRPCVSSSW